MVAPEVVGAQYIGVSPMVCRYPKIDGANILHGLGVAESILLQDHGLLLWKKLEFHGNITNHQFSYVGIV